MHAIKPDCTEQAANMLRTQSTSLGELGSIQFYFLDGKAWLIAGQTVLRSDDSEESILILRACKELQRMREDALTLEQR